MNLLNINQSGSSEDEGSSDESQQLDHEEEEDEETEVDEEEEELSDDESAPNAAHPYPTPPPDADATVSLGNGVKKIQIPNPKPKLVKETIVTAMVESKSSKKTIIGRAMEAIAFLNSRSGSSIRAIVKYMKSTDYEITDERRTSKLVLRSLKSAVAKGTVEQVKLSFKLSTSALKEQKLDAKAKKAQKSKKKNAQKAKEKTEKAKRPKKTKTEVKAEEILKKGDKVKLALAAVVQAVEEEESVKEPEKLAPKGRKEKNTKAAPEKSKKPVVKTKAKPSRKSIGTLANPKDMPKVQHKSIKQLVSGKRGSKNAEDIDLDGLNSSPIKASTPVIAAKQKRQGRVKK